MFRYSRYILILFVALTILPLALMFAFHQNHSKQMHYEHSANIFKIALEQIENNLANYTETDIEKYDLNKIFPSGPFIMELYKGDKITKNNFIKSIKDRYAPPHIGMHPPHRHPEPFFSPDEKAGRLGIPDNNSPYYLFKIKNKKGDITGTILFKMFDLKPHFKFVKIGMFLFLLGIISSLVMGSIVKNTFLDPLLHLSGALKKLQKGDYLTEVDSNYKQKELKSAFDSFNDMVKSLKEKEELRANFISNLTHDLRTPLIAQEKSLELISKEFENLGQEDAHHLSKSLEKNNKHLLRMVNLILEAYRFDARDLRLNFTQENVSKVINDCFEQLKILASEKNISLQNNIPLNSPNINVDRNCLNRILINLISNAISNTPNDGKIELNCNIDKNFFEIILRDNGNGILEKDLKHIFDRYYVGKGYERNIGSGLGLYVCKELVALHKGEISVISKRGEYTQFNIKLPLNK